MGYGINCIATSFFMRAEKIEPARQALINMEWQTGNPSKRASFDDILFEMGWEVYSTDAEGNIEDIGFAGEKASVDDDAFFKALGPFVEAGSFIEMAGEEGERWRYVFTGTECKIVQARLVWDDVKPEAPHVKDIPMMGRGELAVKRRQLSLRVHAAAEKLDGGYVGSSSDYYDRPKRFKTRTIAPWLRLEQQVIQLVEQLDQAMKDSGQF